jgi:L-asparaginase
VEPSLWVRLAHLIRDRYDDYDGFVILHGTDTMAYSASALSFMLEGLRKPVIFTGSQLPIGVPRTDGKENLISAVEIASAFDEDGHPMVPEVSIYFDSVLIRGNRSTKLSAEAFDAFASPDCPPLAEAGIRIRYNRSVIRRPSDWTQPLKVHDRLDTRVSILKVHPGITPEVVTVFLLAPEIRAVILETYGSGNAISRPWFLALIREAAKTKVVVNVTQCKSGTVNMDIYATGKTLKLAGVVSGQDITTEAALGKLFVLMGLYEDNEQVKNRFGEDLIGEISK